MSIVADDEFYFLYHDARQPLTISDKMEINDISIEDSKHVQELPNDFHVNGLHKSYIFVANNIKHKKEWMKVLGKAIEDRTIALSIINETDDTGMYLNDCCLYLKMLGFILSFHRSDNAILLCLRG